MADQQKIFQTTPALRHQAILVFDSLQPGAITISHRLIVIKLLIP